MQLSKQLVAHAQAGCALKMNTQQCWLKIYLVHGIKIDLLPMCACNIYERENAFGERIE